VAKVKDRALRTVTGFQMLFGCFLDVFRCFAKQDRPSDVHIDHRAPAEDLEESSRSQGTTTNPGGDVCGGVKWAALLKSPDLLYAGPGQ